MDMGNSVVMACGDGWEEEGMKGINGDGKNVKLCVCARARAFNHQKKFGRNFGRNLLQPSSKQAFCGWSAAVTMYH